MSKNLKQETQTLEQTAAQLQENAIKAGAETAEVCATFLHKTKISLEKQDFHLASSDHGFVFGLRTIRDEKQGFASCNTTEPKELKEVALRAVEIAGFSPKNPYQVIKRTDNIQKEATLDLFDEELFRLSLQTQKEWTKLLIDEATKDKRFRLNEGMVENISGATLVTNSTGTHKLTVENSAHWNLMGMAVDGSNITSFDYFQEMARTPAQVQEKLLLSTRSFCEQLIDGLVTGVAQSYKGLVAFSPRAVIGILLSGLSYHLNGRNVVEGSTKWRTENFGERVLNEKITIRDLPWLVNRLGAASFDREGTPTKNSAPIEKGSLKEFFLDTYAAKALGLGESTGNAGGGPSSIPGVGANCLCMDAGDEALDALLKRTADSQKDFLKVNRFSGNVDPITGDFSGVAKGAEWWSGGERVSFVKETLISGNIFDVLGNDLFGISKERSVISSSEECPTIVATGVSVTGSQA